MSKLYVIMGKSCSGKDTVFKKIMESDQLNIKSVVGYTTRPIRQGEVDGEEYFFKDRDFLEEAKERGTLIESRDYNTVHGIWSYFTMDDGQINFDGPDLLYIGTLESYVDIRDYYGFANVVPIYIEVSSETRLARAKQREEEQDTPKYEEMKRRLKADDEDFSEEKLKAVGIEKRYSNEILDDCVEEIIKTIKEK
ncbi:MAG: guanylate kinase [Eubacterium sp.]|nr:guanylate kinase [Eubacterium sp.]